MSSPAGGTDFNAALSKAKEMLNNGGGTGCNKAILFMSDGQPDEAPDTEALKNDLDAIGNVRLMTYAMGDGAQADVRRTMACENGGVFRRCPTTATSRTRWPCTTRVLAPSLVPCQTRYTEYTDLVSGKKLLAARTPAYEKTSPCSAENSCNGGLDGLGDTGSSVVAQLLGVVHGHGYDCLSRRAQGALGVRAVRGGGRRREGEVLARVTVSTKRSSRRYAPR